MGPAYDVHAARGQPQPALSGQAQFCQLIPFSLVPIIDTSVLEQNAARKKDELPRPSHHYCHRHHHHPIPRVRACGFLSTARSLFFFVCLFFLFVCFFVLFFLFSLLHAGGTRTAGYPSKRTDGLSTAWRQPVHAHDQEEREKRGRKGRAHTHTLVE